MGLIATVVAPLGICGGCRKGELYNLHGLDIEDTGSQLVVSTNQTKNYVKRVFTVIEENFLQAFPSPKNLQEMAFFIGYRKGKCINQRVGIHSIGGAPRKLGNSERYTYRALFQNDFIEILPIANVTTPS